MKYKKLGTVFTLGILLALANFGAMAYFHDTEITDGFFETGEWIGSCETAWAYGDGYATPFSETGQWGWTNGSLENGSYNFNLYAGAGAGGNDISTGTLVGDLYVNYVDDLAIVRYDIYDSYEMKEVHLYVGSEPLTVPVAPGLFSHNYDFPDDDGEEKTFIVNTSDFSEIWIAAHAVVCDK